MINDDKKILKIVANLKKKKQSVVYQIKPDKGYNMNKGKSKVLLGRFFSAYSLRILMIVCYMVIARLVNNIDTYGQFCLFDSSAYIFGIVLFLGQDRVFINEIGSILAKNKLENRNGLFGYSHLIAIWLLTLLAVLLLSFIVVLLIPHDFKSPILLGILFSPFCAADRICLSLYSSLNKPMLGRFFIILQYCILIAGIYILHHAVKEYGVVELAYIMAISFFFITVIAISLGSYFLYTCIKKIEPEEAAPINFNFMEFLAEIKNHHAPKNNITTWLKNGITFALALIADETFYLIMLILGALQYSLTQISLAYTATLVCNFGRDTSFVLRNHFTPILITQYEQNNLSLKSKASASFKKFMNSFVRNIWFIISGVTLLLFLISPYILKMYGPEFKSSYPMILLFLSLMFFTYGWSFVRGVSMLYPETQQSIRRCQQIRLLAIIILSAPLIYFLGIYGVFICIGIPSLLATLTQLRQFTKVTNTSLIWKQSQ